MVKADIVKRLCSQLQMRERDAHFVTDAILDAMKDLIAAEERLEIRDFGVFQVKTRKPRIGRNPRSKVTYAIPPHRVVTFRSGKDLKNLTIATENGDEDVD